MREWALRLCVGLGLIGLPSFAHHEKKTDPCGCHHQWGLRHCHPKKKTPRCEAPARSQARPDAVKAKARSGERSASASL
ncbi:MAG TPA: hypothetical protein VE549_04435 [Myxococcaceae bacterium]|nr:hypothetical protein [Myxococcaceae bacterium]